MAFDFKTFGTTSDTAVKPAKGGFDMSEFGAETEQPVVEPVKPDNKTKGTVGKIADFLGIEKFGRGLGTAASNVTGTQDKLITLHDQSMAIADQLRERIKTNKAQGKDTSKLEKTLDTHIKTNADFLNTINDVGTSGLTDKEVIGSALNLAGIFVPGAPKGSGLLKKAAVGAATGYTFDVANDLQNNKSTKEILTPGTGTLVGVSLPVITSIFGKGAKLEQINERLTPTEKRNLGEKGKATAQYLVDKRVFGTPEQRLAKVDGLYKKMEDKIQGEITKANAFYDKKDVINSLNAVKDEFLNKPAEYQEISNKIDGVVKFMQEKSPGQIPGKLLNEYKRSLADSAFNEKGNKVLSEGLKTASDVLYGFLQKNIKTLKPLNAEYAKIITAKSLLNTAATRSQIGLFEKGAAFAAGGAVGQAIFPGGLGFGGGAYVAPKVANAVATPVRSATAVGLNEINKLIEKIPVDKVGNLQLTKKALIKLITGK